MHQLYEKVWQLFDLSFGLLSAAEDLAEYIREHPEIEEPVRAALWAVLDSFNTMQAELYWVLLMKK